eukprot:5302870-Prymnesium_polylepis.1
MRWNARKRGGRYGRIQPNKAVAAGAAEAAWTQGYIDGIMSVGRTDGQAAAAGRARIDTREMCQGGPPSSELGDGSRMRGG